MTHGKVTYVGGVARAYRTVGGCQQNNVRPLPVPLCYRSLSVLSASIRNASPSPLPTPLELGRLNTSVATEAKPLKRCTFERPVVFAVGPYCCTLFIYTLTLYSARPPSSECSPALRGRPARVRRPGGGLVGVCRDAGRARPAARGARGRASGYLARWRCTGHRLRAANGNAGGQALTLCVRWPLARVAVITIYVVSQINTYPELSNFSYL